MTVDYKLLIGGCAIAVLGAAAGFVIARATDPHIGVEVHDDEHGKAEHKENEHAVGP